MCFDTLVVGGVGAIVFLCPRECSVELKEGRGTKWLCVIVSLMMRGFGTETESPAIGRDRRTFHVVVVVVCLYAMRRILFGEFERFHFVRQLQQTVMGMIFDENDVRL